VGCTNNVPKRIFVMQAWERPSREWSLAELREVNCAPNFFFLLVDQFANFSSAAEEKRTKF
jgi:hypothetical protein